MPTGLNIGCGINLIFTKDKTFPSNLHMNWKLNIINRIEEYFFESNVYSMPGIEFRVICYLFSDRTVYIYLS